MLRLYSERTAEKKARQYGDRIAEAEKKYGIPAAAIRAVMLQEMTQMDVLDPLVDLVVRLRLPIRRDSSVGYMQIFGKTGIDAVNFAKDRGLALYEDFGIPEGRRLAKENPEDVRLMWKILKKDPGRNIDIAALNLLSCACEMTGSLDFARFTADDWRRTFSRYNAKTRGITDYGRAVYARIAALGGKAVETAEGGADAASV